LAERAQATDRVQIVLSVYGQLNRNPAFVANFTKAYGTLVFLYDVIDHGRSAVPDDGDPSSARHRISVLSPARARSLAADFIAAPSSVSDALLAAIVDLAHADRALVRTVRPTTVFYRERDPAQPH
jgi:hypothetical protein